MVDVETPQREFVRTLDHALASSLTTPRLLEAAAEDSPLQDPHLEVVFQLGFHGVFVHDSEQPTLGWGELAALFVTAGRRLLPTAIRDEAVGLTPLLATAAADGDGDAEAWLDALLQGSLRGGGAVLTDDTRAQPDAPLTRIPSAFRHPPHVGFVLERDRAAAFPMDHPDVVVEPLRTVDPGQGHARLSVALGQVPRPRRIEGPIAHRLWNRWHVAVLAETLGCAQEALTASVRFAGEHEQFGQPIAGFQAIAHRLAKMRVAVEGGRSGIARLASLLADDDPAAANLLQALTFWIPREARSVVESAIHVHGATGFTWEQGLHLYYRRILMNQALLGGANGAARRVGLARIRSHEEEQTP